MHPQLRRLLAAAHGNRWVIYQRERFPLGPHAALVAAFSTSALCFSSLLRGHVAIPPPASLIVAFATSLLFFLQLRIADELKDREEDRRHRPYRPVPRGLVSLRELGVAAALAAAVQLVLALWLHATLAPLLVLVWTYLALMTCEFFAGRWLRRHHPLYMASHLVILPLIDLYATACDWLVAGASAPPSGLSWFLIVSLLNGLVFEIGRKTRPPLDEEPSVDTYSARWGLGRAVGAWAVALVLTGFAAGRAAGSIGTAAPTLAFLVLVGLTCLIGAAHLVRSQAPGSGRVVELMSAMWTVAMYLALGAVPLLLAVWRGEA